MNESDDESNINFYIKDKNDVIYDKKETNDIVSEISGLNNDIECISNVPINVFFSSNLWNSPSVNDKDNVEYNLNFKDEDIFELPYCKKKSKYDGDDYMFYNNEYTIKGLIKICEYYKIDKDIKYSKCKKQEIIYTIILFESLAENQPLVYKRHQMWAYMDALSNDERMRKYIFWN